MKIGGLFILIFVYVRDTDAIIGGRNVTIEEVPWLVLLKSVTKLFSGVLISEHHILSIATYCPTKDIVAFVGFSQQIKNGLGYSIDSYKMHPKYDPKKDAHYANICVLRTKKPIQLQKNIQKAALPYMNEEIPAGYRIRVAAWGPHTIMTYKEPAVYPTAGEFKVKALNASTAQDLMWLQYNDASKEKVLFTGDEGGPAYIPAYGKVIGLIAKVIDKQRQSHIVVQKLMRFMDWIDEQRTGVA